MIETSPLSIMSVPKLYLSSKQHLNREGISIPIELRTRTQNLEPLLRFIQTQLANKFSRIWHFEEGTVGVFTRDKYMLRNGQTLQLL